MEGALSQTLSGVVTNQAMVNPDRDCVVDVARTWSYGETASAIEKQTAALLAAGVNPGDRVGVHLKKSAEGFIAMHAALSAGAVAVPLDPGSPAARLARICDDMGISVVSSHDPLKQSLAALHELSPLRGVVGADVVLDGAQVVSSDDVAMMTSAPPATVAENDPSYIVTTSGSTGEPKGIVHTHSSGRAFADMAIGAFGIDENDRVSDISPHHFDISALSLWSSPLVGATNIVVNEAYQSLPASHSQLLADQAVTIWYSVPFLLQQLLLRGDLANRDLGALRWVVFAGEVVPAEIIGEMMSHCSNARFANGFGPAETNVVSLAVFDMAPNPDLALPIGHPVDQTLLRIIDPSADTPIIENEVPTGEIGEMWSATPQLMTGYWNRDDVNDRVLKSVDGHRFYRSGDLASVDSDGQLAFHGRVDNQIKVRGYRIELEGIEVELETLVKRMAVAENVVVSVLRQPSGEDEIVAGILGATSDFDPFEFQRSAASVVPSYAVPVHTVQINASAFTGSGKLDRGSLRRQAVALTEEKS